MTAVPASVGARRVVLRPMTADDDAFLRMLCLDARPELRLLPSALVDLQRTAQTAQHRRDHPDSVDEIVELDGAPVGRCWTAEAGGELLLLDLAVQADRRGRGIGRAVLGTVADRAADRGQAVRLSVWAANADARRLYGALGFTEVGAAGGHVVMRLAPGRRE